MESLGGYDRWKLDESENPFKQEPLRKVKCDNCGGKGWFDNENGSEERCRRCGGDGYEELY